MALTLPIVAAMGKNDWHRVAENDIAFAKGLGTADVKFGPEFIKLIADTVEACQPNRSKCAGRSEAELRQIDLFCTRYCVPWRDAWAEALSPCEADRPPGWCRNGRLAAKEIDLEPYFSTLSAAIHNSQDGLERFNIMAVIAERIGKKVLRDYPRAQVDAWVADALSGFLRGAAADDAIAIARMLNNVSFGRKSGTVKELLAYAERSRDLNEGQRKEIRELAADLRERPD